MRSKLALALFFTAFLAATAPSVVAAAVTINLAPQGQPQATNLILTPTSADQTLRIEVFAVDTDGSDERLNAYTIAVTGTGTDGFGRPFGDPNAIRFLVPGATFGVAGQPKEHPYVFKDFETIPPIENFSSTPSKLQFAATAVGQDDEVNLDPTHNGLIAFGLIVPANYSLGYGVYTIAVTTSSLAGLGAPIVSSPGSPLTIAIVPEPTAAALLLLFPPLALLRRRPAGLRWGPRRLFL